MSAVVKQDDGADLERWNALLEAISSGAKIEDACLAARVTSAEITVFTLNQVEAARWAAACLAAKLRRWPQLERDEIFRRLATGKKVPQVLEEVRGSADDAGEFYELLDIPEMADRYAAAQRASMRAMAERLGDIASNDSRDILDNGKGGQVGNMAAVSRDKLRVENGQWFLSAHLPEVYGQQKASTNIQINVDYAGTLEANRTRAKERGKLKVTPKQMNDAVDAVFSSVAEENRRGLAAGMATADRLRAEPAEPEQPAAEQPASEEPIKNFGLDD
jgi:hypothetical protein